jgi:hypothetical protein
MPVAARKSAPLQPAEILEQIADLKAQKPELERRMGEEAELSVSSGDDTRYNAAVDALVAHDQNVRRLEAALSGAEARSKEEARAQRLAAAASLRAHVGKLLDQRLPVAEKIEKAITDLVRGWRELIELSDKALTAYPGGPPPSGLALSNSELITLVAGEMARLGNVPPITGRPVVGRQTPSLPAPRSPDFMLAGMPERITPLRVQIERANETARNHMEGKQHAA